MRTRHALRRWSGLIALCLVALAAEKADAHRLHAEVQVQGGELTLEIYFSDGIPAANARVRVLLLGEGGRADTSIAAGTTDSSGTFRCRLDAPGRYRLDATDPGLHKATVEVVVGPADLSVGAGAADPASVSSRSVAPDAATVNSASGDPGHAHESQDRVPLGRAVLGLLIIVALAVGVSWVRKRSA